ncbi:HSP20-like chaperone [Hyaloraphidium curvatum]|nr:HSP20-like chaperone [Hyaloraphidium curvatum]
MPVPANEPSGTSAYAPVKPSDQAREAATREAAATDATKEATGLISSMMSSLPTLPRSKDELLQQINQIESNLKAFYDAMMAEAQRSYPEQLDKLKGIAAAGMANIESLRNSIPTTLEQAKEQVQGQTSSWKSWPSDLHTQAAAKFPVLGTLEAQATNVLANVPRLGSGIAWAPTADLFEEEGAFVVVLDLPGVDKGRVGVSIKGMMLTVEGTVDPRQGEAGTARMQERRSGKFFRSIAIPAAVRDEMAEITLDKAVLEVRMPKSAAVSAGKQPVRA